MIHFQSTSHTSTMFTTPFVFASHLLVIQSTASFIARLRMSGVSANKWCSPCNLYEQIVYIKICTNFINELLKLVLKLTLPLERWSRICLCNAWQICEAVDYLQLNKVCLSPHVDTRMVLLYETNLGWQASW